MSHNTLTVSGDREEKIMFHQPITTIERNDQMLAVELQHRVPMCVPAVVASLIISEMGAPAIRSRQLNSWYGYFHLEEKKTPFALYMDHNGQTSIAASILETDALANALEHLVPAIEIIEIRGRR
jgi:hypothetical protein